MSSLAAVLRSPRLTRLILAYAINSIGTWIGQMAIALLVLRRTGSAGAVAAVWTMGYFAPALLAPPLTASLERAGTHLALPGLFAFEAAMFSLLALTANSAALALGLLLVTVDGAAGMSGRALLKSSIVATTKPAGLLREGNTILTAAFTICSTLGPILGGLITALASSAAGLWADAASFALAAVLLTGSHAPSGAAPNHETLGARIRAGIAHVTENAPLRRLIGGYTTAAILGAAILPLEVVLVTHTLHAGPTSYGAVLALWGGGAMLGGLLTSTLRHASLTGLLATALVLTGIAYAGMGAAPTIAVVFAFSLLGGIGNGIEAFAAMTAIQENTADAFQTRIATFVEALTSGGLGIGFILGGAIAELTTPRAVYAIAGLAMLGLAAAITTPRTTPAVKLAGTN